MGSEEVSSVEGLLSVNDAEHEMHHPSKKLEEAQRKDGKEENKKGQEVTSLVLRDHRNDDWKDEVVQTTMISSLHHQADQNHLKNVSSSSPTKHQKGEDVEEGEDTVTAPMPLPLLRPVDPSAPLPPSTTTHSPTSSVFSSPISSYISHSLFSHSSQKQKPRKKHFFSFSRHLSPTSASVSSSSSTCTTVRSPTSPVLRSFSSSAPLGTPAAANAFPTPTRTGVGSEGRQRTESSFSVASPNTATPTKPTPEGVRLRLPATWQDTEKPTWKTATTTNSNNNSNTTSTSPTGRRGSPSTSVLSTTTLGTPRREEPARKGGTKQSHPDRHSHTNIPFSPFTSSRGKHGYSTGPHYRLVGAAPPLTNVVLDKGTALVPHLSAQEIASPLGDAGRVEEEKPPPPMKGEETKGNGDSKSEEKTQEERVRGKGSDFPLLSPVEKKLEQKKKEEEEKKESKMHARRQRKENISSYLKRDGTTVERKGLLASVIPSPSFRSESDRSTRVGNRSHEREEEPSKKGKAKEESKKIPPLSSATVWGGSASSSSAIPHLSGAAEARTAEEVVPGAGASSGSPLSTPLTSPITRTRGRLARISTTSTTPAPTPPPPSSTIPSVYFRFLEEARVFFRPLDEKQKKKNGTEESSPTNGRGPAATGRPERRASTGMEAKGSSATPASPSSFGAGAGVASQESIVRWIQEASDTLLQLTAIPPPPASTFTPVASPLQLPSLCSMSSSPFPPRSPATQVMRTTTPNMKNPTTTTAVQKETEDASTTGGDKKEEVDEKDQKLSQRTAVPTEQRVGPLFSAPSPQTRTPRKGTPSNTALPLSLPSSSLTRTPIMLHLADPEETGLPSSPSYSSATSFPFTSDTSKNTSMKEKGEGKETKENTTIRPEDLFLRAVHLRPPLPGVTVLPLAPKAEEDDDDDEGLITIPEEQDGSPSQFSSSGRFPKRDVSDSAGNEWNTTVRLARNAEEDENNENSERGDEDEEEEIPLHASRSSGRPSHMDPHAQETPKGNSKAWKKENRITKEKKKAPERIPADLGTPSTTSVAPISISRLATPPNTTLDTTSEPGSPPPIPSITMPPPTPFQRSIPSPPPLPSPLPHHATPHHEKPPPPQQEEEQAASLIDESMNPSLSESRSIEGTHLTTSSAATTTTNSAKNRNKSRRVGLSLPTPSSFPFMGKGKSKSSTLREEVGGGASPSVSPSHRSTCTLLGRVGTPPALPLPSVSSPLSFPTTTPTSAGLPFSIRRQKTKSGGIAGISNSSGTLTAREIVLPAHARSSVVVTGPPSSTTPPLAGPTLSRTISSSTMTTPAPLLTTISMTTATTMSTSSNRDGSLSISGEGEKEKKTENNPQCRANKASPPQEPPVTSTDISSREHAVHASCGFGSLDTCPLPPTSFSSRPTTTTSLPLLTVAAVADVPTTTTTLQEGQYRNALLWTSLSQLLWRVLLSAFLWAPFSISPTPPPSTSPSLSVSAFSTTVFSSSSSSALKRRSHVLSTSTSRPPSLSFSGAGPTGVHGRVSTSLVPSTSHTTTHHHQQHGGELSSLLGLALAALQQLYHDTTPEMRESWVQCWMGDRLMHELDIQERRPKRCTVHHDGRRSGKLPQDLSSPLPKKGLTSHHHRHHRHSHHHRPSPSTSLFLSYPCMEVAYETYTRYYGVHETSHEAVTPPATSLHNHRSSARPFSSVEEEKESQGGVEVSHSSSRLQEQPTPTTDGPPCHTILTHEAGEEENAIADPHSMEVSTSHRARPRVRQTRVTSRASDSLSSLRLAQARKRRLSSRRRPSHPTAKGDREGVHGEDRSTRRRAQKSSRSTSTTTMSEQTNRPLPTTGSSHSESTSSRSSAGMWKDLDWDPKPGEGNALSHPSSSSFEVAGTTSGEALMKEPQTKPRRRFSVRRRISSTAPALPELPVEPTTTTISTTMSSGIPEPEEATAERITSPRRKSPWKEEWDGQEDASEAEKPEEMEKEKIEEDAADDKGLLFCTSEGMVQCSVHYGTYLALCVLLSMYGGRSPTTTTEWKLLHQGVSLLYHMLMATSSSSSTTRCVEDLQVRMMHSCLAIAIEAESEEDDEEHGTAEPSGNESRERDTEYRGSRVLATEVRRTAEEILEILVQRIAGAFVSHSSSSSASFLSHLLCTRTPLESVLEDVHVISPFKKIEVGSIENEREVEKQQAWDRREAVLQHPLSTREQGGGGGGWWYHWGSTQCSPSWFSRRRARKKRKKKKKKKKNKSSTLPEVETVQERENIEEDRVRRRARAEKESRDSRTHLDASPQRGDAGMEIKEQNPSPEQDGRTENTLQSQQKKHHKKESVMEEEEAEKGEEAIGASPPRHRHRHHPHHHRHAHHHQHHHDVYSKGQDAMERSWLPSPFPRVGLPRTPWQEVSGSFLPPSEVIPTQELFSFLTASPSAPPPSLLVSSPSLSAASSPPALTHRGYPLPPRPNSPWKRRSTRGEGEMDTGAGGGLPSYLFFPLKFGGESGGGDATGMGGREMDEGRLHVSSTFSVSATSTSAAAVGTAMTTPSSHPTAPTTGEASPGETRTPPLAPTPTTEHEKKEEEERRRYPPHSSFASSSFSSPRPPGTLEELMVHRVEKVMDAEGNLPAPLRVFEFCLRRTCRAGAGKGIQHAARRCSFRCATTHRPSESSRHTRSSHPRGKHSLPSSSPSTSSTDHAAWRTLLPAHSSPSRPPPSHRKAEKKTKSSSPSTGGRENPTMREKEPLPHTGKQWEEYLFSTARGSAFSPALFSASRLTGGVPLHTQAASLSMEVEQEEAYEAEKVALRARRLGVRLLHLLLRALPFANDVSEHACATWLFLVLSACKYDILSCLLTNLFLSDSFSLFQSSVQILGKLLCACHYPLGRELQTLLAVFLLPLMASPCSHFRQKLAVLSMIREVFQQRNVVISFFLNYDCNPTLDPSGEYRGMLEMLVAFVMEILFADQRLDPLPLFSSSMREEENKGEEEGGGAPHEKGGKELGKHGGNGVVRRRTSSPSSFSSSSSDSDTSSTSSCASSSSFSGRDGTGMLWGGPEAGSPKRTSITMTSPLCGAAASSLTPVFLLSSPSHFFSLDTILPHLALSHRSIPASVTPWREAHAMPSTTTSYYDRKKARTSSRHEKRRDEAPDDEEETHRKTGLVGEVGSPLRVRAFRSTAGGGKHRAGGGGGEVSWVLETESDGKLNKKKRDEEGEDRKEISATLREGTGETGAASPRGYLTLDQQRQLRREGVLAFQSLITSLYTWVTEDPKEMATAVLQHSSPTTTARELPRYGTRTANESWDGMAHAFSAASLPEVSAPFFSSKAGPPLSLWPWCYCKDRAGTRVLTGLRGSPWLQQQLELPSYEGSSSSSSLSSSSSSVQSSFSSSSVVEAEEQATPQRTKWRRRSAPLPGSVERSERSPMTTLHTSITTTTEERKRSPRNVSEPSRGTSNLTREPSGTPFLSTTPHDVDDHHHDAHDTHRTPLLPTLKRRRSETRSRPTTGGVTSTSRDGWQESVCLMTPPPSLSLGTWEEDAPPMLRSPLPRPPLPPTGATSQVASPFLPTGSPLSALFLLPPPPPPSSPSFTRSPPDSRKRRDPPPSPSSFTSPFLFSTPWPSTCSCNNYHQYLRYLCGQKIAEESRRYTQKGSHMGMDVEEEKEMEETTGTRNTHSAPHPTNTRRPPSHPLPEAEMAPPEVGDPYRWERVRYLAEGGPATNPPRRSICHARQAMDRERSTNTSSSSSSSSQRGSGHTSPGSGSLHSSGSRSEVEEEKSDRLRLAARYTIRREWRRSINPVWFLMLPSQAHASRWLARRYHHLGEGGMDTPEEMAHASSPPGPTTGGDENDAPMRLPEAMPQSGIEEEEDAEAEEAYYWYWCGEEERTWERAHGMTPFLSSSFSFSPGAAAELSPLHPTSPSPMTGSPVGPSPPPFLIRYHWKHIHHLRQNHLLAVEACRMIDDGRWKEAKQFLETHEYLPRISPSADELQGLSLPPGKSSYAPFARFLFEHPNIRREAMEGIFDRVNKRQDNGPKYIAGEFFHLLPYRGVPIDIAFCDTICRFVSWERPMFESDTWGVLQSVFGEAYAIQNKDDPDWHLSASDAGTMGGVLLFLHSMLHNKNVGSEGQLGEGDFVASALDCLDTPLKEETMREIYARVAKKKWELDGYGRTPCQAAWETQACNEPLTTRVWRQRSEGLRRALLRCERWKEMEAMWLKNAYEEVIGVRLAEAERRKRKQKKRQRRQRRKEERRKEKQRRQKAAGKQEETTPHTKDEGEAAASADEEKKREGQEIPFSPYTFSNSFFLSPDFFKDHWGDSPRVGSVEKMSFAPPHRRQSFPFTTDDQTMRPTETTREKHERQEGTRRGTHSQRGIQGSMPREYPGGGESFSVASCPSSVGVSSLSRSRKGKPHKPRNPKLKKDERTGSWKMDSLSFSSVSSSSMSTEWKRMNASSAPPSFSFFLLFVLRAVHECHEWYYTNALAYLKRKLQEAEEKQRPHVPTTEQDGEAERETAGASGCERPDTRKTGTHSMASAGPQKRKDPSVVSSGQAYSSPSSSAVPSSRHSQDEEAMEHTHTPLRLSTLQPTFPRYVEELTRVPAVRAALGVKEQNGGSGGVAGREVEDRGGSAGAGGSTTTTSSRKGTGKVLSRLQLSKRLSTTMLASTLPSGVITGSSTSLEKKSHRTTTAKRTRYTSPLPFIGAVLSAPTNATASASFSSAAVSTASFFHQWYKKADPALKKLEQLHQLFFFSRFAFTPQPYVLPHYAEHVRPILQLIMPSILAGLYWVLRETDEVPMHYLVTDLHQQLGELASFFLLQMDGLEQAVEETLKKYLLGPHSGRLVPPYRATFALHQYFL